MPRHWLMEGDKYHKSFVEPCNELNASYAADGYEQVVVSAIFVADYVFCEAIPSGTAQSLQSTAEAA